MFFDDGIGDELVRLGIALALGLLVGLERERRHERLAGLRTFPLVTTLGYLSAALGIHFGGLVVAAGFLAVALVVVGLGWWRARGADDDDEHPGATTEIAALVMFCVGGYLAIGSLQVAVGLGVITAALLHLKPELHGLAGKISHRDMAAIVQFAVVAFVVYPVLPDRTIDPYAVVNPREVWLMVVLVSGISLLGYVFQRALGSGVGHLLAGAVGGLVSSTATTVSMARQSRSSSMGSTAGLAAAAIVASTVLYGRVLVEVVVVAPRFALAVAPSMAVMAAASLGGIAAVLVLGRRARASLVHGPLRADAVESAAEAHTAPAATEPRPPRNPAELGPALFFALIYAAVKFGIAVVDAHLGADWLFSVALISGLTDVDAITLSTSHLVAEGALEAGLGARLITVAVLSNLVFKTGVVVVLGTRGMARRVGLVFAASGALGALAMVFL